MLPRALECEIDMPLGYPKHDLVGDGCGDSRNRYPPKTVLTENQEAGIPIPQDRKGTFEPYIMVKPQKRVPLVNDQSISLYATDRDINAHLEKLY
jgi:transposase-like protein